MHKQLRRKETNGRKVVTQRRKGKWGRTEGMNEIRKKWKKGKGNCTKEGGSKEKKTHHWTLGWGLMSGCIPNTFFTYLHMEHNKVKFHSFSDCVNIRNINTSGLQLVHLLPYSIWFLIVGILMVHIWNSQISLEQGLSENSLSKGNPENVSHGWYRNA